MAECMMEELRIAIIDSVGIKAGLDHYDLSLARALKQQSVHAKVYSNFESDDGHAEKKFSMYFYSWLSGLIKYLPEYFSALRSAKKDRAGIVILHLFHASFIDYLSILLAGFFGFRRCIIVHDVESMIENRRSSWLRSCISNSDYVVVHNESTCAGLIAKMSVKNKKKISIIPHGNFLDLPGKQNREEALGYFQLHPEKKYLLFFGMIKKSKGLVTLIEAMKDISPDAELIIAGRERDDSFANYKSMIGNLNLSGRIHSFPRYHTNEERNMLFSAAEAVVLPYRRVYQSGVLLMAMSLGVPVIASDLPSMREETGEVNGILFEPGNAVDLSAKINLLLTDRDKKNQIIKNAKAHVSKNHNWNEIADSFKTLLAYR